MTTALVRRLPGLVLILLGVLAPPAIAAPESPSEASDDVETRKAVTAVKQGILAGHKARDRAALDRLYADDYTATDSKGKVTTKKELLDGLPKSPEIAEGTYELVAVRRLGNVVVASGHGHLVYRNSDGTTRVSDYDSVNVFEKRGDRWYYVAAFLP